MRPRSRESPNVNDTALAGEARIKGVTKTAIPRTTDRIVNFTASSYSRKQTGGRYLSPHRAIPKASNRKQGALTGRTLCRHVQERNHDKMDQTDTKSSRNREISESVYPRSHPRRRLFPPRRYIEETHQSRCPA